MKKLNQIGGLDIFAVLFGASALFLIVAVSFGGWAYSSRSDFKNKSDDKSAAAVELALGDQKIKLAADFAEQAKQPYKTYKSPDAYGSAEITYPRSWNAYVVESSKGNTPVNGYFHPGFVPSVSGGESFALRFQIVDKTIDSELRAYDAVVKSGAATASPFKAKNVATDKTGYRIDGEFTKDRKGSMILLPLRDKTMKIWAESEDFLGDLNTIVLENLTYIP